jgi:DNA polymerase III delta prime subunit
MIFEVFSPSTPVSNADLLLGRTDLVLAMISGVQEIGTHVILFGERGVGKTSVANVIERSFTSDPRVMEDEKRSADAEFSEPDFCVKVNADTQDDFTSLWNKVFQRIMVLVDLPAIGFNRDRQQTTISLLDAALQCGRELCPTEVIRILSGFRKCNVVIDEIDRLRGEAVKSLLSDTIKGLSDQALLHTLILVGVGRSVADLIGAHPSIERCLKQIPVNRLSSTYLEGIIDCGMRKLKMTVDPAVRTIIARLSNGFPHFTHLLAQRATLSAFADRSEDYVSRQDLDGALRTVTMDAEGSLRRVHVGARGVIRATELADEILLACALAFEDDEHTFSADDLRASRMKIRGISGTRVSYSQHLGKLATEDSGAILERVGTGKPYRYRFSNPAMKSYLLIEALSQGRIDDDFYESGRGGKTMADDPLSPDREPTETRIVIREGQKGISYRRLFFPYLKFAREIRVVDPFIRKPHQIRNLINFCEIIPLEHGRVTVTLLTKCEPQEEAELTEKLNELKENLEREGIALEIRFDPNIHDREIVTDTEWHMHLGRGLDIFRYRASRLSLGESDQTRRECKACTISYHRCQEKGSR